MQHVNIRLFQMSKSPKTTCTLLTIIINGIRSLSIVLQDADVAFPRQELTHNQRMDLDTIDMGCWNILDELQQILDKNSDLSPEISGLGKRSARVWKRLKWRPEEINELRSRITSNIALFLNACMGRYTRDNIAKLVQHPVNQDRENALNWIAPIKILDPTKSIHPSK